MRLNQEERVAFRFSVEEMGALLSLMGIQRLDAIDLVARMPEDEDVLSLLEDGYVMRLGENVYLDNVISLLIKEMERARVKVSVEGNRACALYVGKRVSVVLKRGACVEIEAFKDCVMAANAFASEATGTADEIRYRVHIGESVKEGLGNRERLRLELGDMLRGL